MKNRIHLFDLVTSSELKGLEGLWLLKDFKTGENVECPGCFITV
jgi:hypothetical protein